LKVRPGAAVTGYLTPNGDLFLYAGYKKYGMAFLLRILFWISESNGGESGIRAV
jgi:hypothetical protein